MTEIDIDARLCGIEQLLNVQITELRRLVVRHDDFLFGTSTAPGLDKRVDRLDQVDSRRTWHLRALWTAALSMVAGLVHLLTKKI